MDVKENVGSRWSQRVWKEGENHQSKRVREEGERRKEYKVKLKKRWSVLESEEVENVEEEWKKFKSGVLKCAKEVCGILTVSRKGKRSEWWDESLSEPL